MPCAMPLQDRFPNREGVYTELRLLTSADLDAQIQHHQEQAREHGLHAEALVDYRNRVFDRSRHGR